MLVMPRLSCVRALLNTPWTSIEVQTGKLRHRSLRFPGAWSAAALLVHTSTDIFVYCDSIDWRDGERFVLQFAERRSESAASQLASARPPHRPIVDWPNDLLLPEEFLAEGPSSVKMGLGTTIPDQDRGGKVVPILWCRFYSTSSSLMLYADGEIPLNVGIVTNPGSISAIMSELRANTMRQI